VLGYFHKDQDNMITLRTGVVVDTKGRYNSSVGLADVVEQKDGNSKTLITATFPDGNEFVVWVDTNELEVVKYDDRVLEKANKKLQTELQVKSKSLEKVKKDHDIEAELARAYRKELEEAKKLWEDGIEQLDRLVEELKD